MLRGTLAQSRLELEVGRGRGRVIKRDLLLEYFMAPHDGASFENQNCCQNRVLGVTLRDRAYDEEFFEARLDEINIILKRYRISKAVMKASEAFPTVAR